MKTKLISAVLSAALIFSAAIAFSACDSLFSDDGDYALLESGETIVLIEAKKTGGSLEDALKYFKDAGDIDYSATDGDYGLMLNSLNGYTPNAASNEFIAIYTTLGTYEGVEYSSTEFGTYEYDGKVLGSAMYGVSGLPMIEGNLYVLTISVW